MNALNRFFLFLCFCLGIDDCPEALKTRLEKFKVETEPILDLYKNAGIIHNISADDSFDNVWKDINICFSSGIAAVEGEN